MASGHPQWHRRLPWRAAYEKVPALEDGDRWRPKVDWEAAERADLFVKLRGNTTRIPATDEEIRKGMDQEPFYIRTAMRLEEATACRDPICSDTMRDAHCLRRPATVGLACRETIQPLFRALCKS